MSKNTKKCPACGAQVPDKMRYCGWCGFDTSKPLPAEEEMLPRPVRLPKAPRPVETSRWVDEERPEEENERVADEPRSIWRMVLVLCIIAAIIAVAVALVVRMNRPAEQKEPSETFQAVHVITTDGEELTPLSTPADAADNAQPEQTAEPVPETTESPEETEPPESTESPEATEAPIDVTPVDDTVYVTGSSVNLRAGPGTDYDVVGSVVRGAELSRTGTTNGWSRISYNGHTCYISSSLISTEKPAPTATPDPASYTVTAVDDKVVVKSAANLRSGPGTGYEIVGTAEVGKEFARTGKSGGWSRVVANGQEVFINDNLISVSGGDTGTESSSGTLTVTSDVNIRSGPGTDYNIIGKAKTGDTLELVDDSGSWYKINYNGQTAYVFSNYVKKG